MERLTHKVKEPKHPCYVDMFWEEYETKNKHEAINKLGKLEDLEEQIGCPLEVRCKLCDGAEIFTKKDGKFIVDKIDKYSFHAYSSKDSYFMETFNYFNYKLTWWLKKDKSE